MSQPEKLPATYVSDAYVQELVQRVEALQRENERLKAESERRMDHICAIGVHLKTPVGMNSADYAKEVSETLERLKAPVSDEEWMKSYWQADGGMRSFVNAFIASRAIQETGVKRDMQSPMAGGDSREKPAPQSTENGK